MVKGATTITPDDSSGAPAEPASGSEPDGAPNVRLPVAIGFAAIAVFFGVFGAWGALVPLDSAAIAPGVVSVDTNRKTLQHFEGGIVSAIRVREGDKVVAGQVLIRLDDTQARATLDLLRGRRVAAGALDARLIAERDGKDEITFPGWLVQAREDQKSREIIDGQVNIFNSRRTALAGQTSILNRGMGQFSEEINGLHGQIDSEDRQYELISEELKGLRDLFEKGFAKKPRILALEREAARIKGNRSQNIAGIARAEQSIAEARLRINELQTAMINEAVAELREVQSELFDLSERIKAAEDVLRRTEIRAPLDGTVVDLQVHTRGGVIGPGARLLDIVPSGERLVVEARVDPGDIDVVHPGLQARVRFTAFNLRSTVAVDGTVTSVSADTLVDDRSGASYYLARVELAEDFTNQLADASLYPGMPAEVMIVTGARTALDYFMRPITRSLNRAFRED
jgi:HlyD family type I secretion membrane fusion protein